MFLPTPSPRSFQIQVHPPFDFTSPTEFTNLQPPNPSRRLELDPKAALVDGVFGTAIGPENVVAILSEMPVPAFGGWRIASTIAGPKAALVELEFAPGRPRAAHWVRVVEDRVVLVESYWMLREIGVRSDAGNNPRHAKQVILPI